MFNKNILRQITAYGRYVIDNTSHMKEKRDGLAEFKTGSRELNFHSQVSSYYVSLRFFEELPSLFFHPSSVKHRPAPRSPRRLRVIHADAARWQMLGGDINKKQTPEQSLGILSFNFSRNPVKR